MNPIILYRLANWLFKNKFPVIPSLITYSIRFIFSAYIPHTMVAGRGFKLGYGGLGVVLHGRTKMGYNCHIDQNVTIGGTSKKFNVPVLGDNVYVGAGAKILGPVKIGNNVVIGANAVIVNDVPDGSLVVGIPGKIIKTNILKSDYV